MALKEDHRVMVESHLARNSTAPLRGEQPDELLWREVSKLVKARRAERNPVPVTENDFSFLKGRNNKWGVLLRAAIRLYDVWELLVDMGEHGRRSRFWSINYLLNIESSSLGVGLHHNHHVAQY